MLYKLLKFVPHSLISHADRRLIMRSRRPMIIVESKCVQIEISAIDSVSLQPDGPGVEAAITKPDWPSVWSKGWPLEMTIAQCARNWSALIQFKLLSQISLMCGLRRSLSGYTIKEYEFITKYNNCNLIVVWRSIDHSVTACLVHWPVEFDPSRSTGQHLTRRV